ncbi:transposase domain-containing protein [Microbispora bryophytorum]|uniref:transposase domain-containing protein n=1 Tax=Microbispora bryophytorum TaxID=1460882 RepID=UPI0033F26522
MVDEALAVTGRVQTRIRDLPSRVVIYLLLAGCLFPELGWRQVWQRLTAGLAGLRERSLRPRRPWSRRPSATRR